MAGLRDSSGRLRVGIFAFDFFYYFSLSNSTGLGIEAWRLGVGSIIAEKAESRRFRAVFLCS